MNRTVHLPRILALLYSLCFRYSYMLKSAEILIKMIVVLITKKKVTDVSDKENYRSISLGTITAEVMDAVLDKRLCNK